MGNLFEREYYRVSAAAAEIGCDVDDLIHWAATGRILLGVLYEIHGFELEQHRYIDDASTWSDRVEEFAGFVYIHSGYFQDMEREGGNLNFYSVRLMNGREISNMAIVENDKCETRSLDQIYIHSNDLRKLLSDGKPTTDDKPTTETGGAHVSDKLQFLKQAAFKFWASQSETSRSTHPDNAAVEAWLMKCGFSAKEADAASSIIRPKWAKPGRKPKE